MNRLPPKTRKVYRAKEPNQAKLFLFGYRSLLHQQEALLDALAEYREKSTRATSRLTATRVSGTSFCSPLESNAIRAVDAERELDNAIQDIGERLREILRAIGSLTDERHKEILTMRYVAGYGWEEIVKRVPYERTQVFEIHGKALLAIERLRFSKERTKSD